LLGFWGIFLVWLFTLKKKKKQVEDAPNSPKDDKTVSNNTAKQVKRDSLKSLIGILLPHLNGYPGLVLGTYAVSLMSRVLVTVKLADLTGELIACMGVRDWDGMFHGQVVFGLWCLVASGTTTMMKVLEKEVALTMRSILFNHLINHYLNQNLGYLHQDLRDASARLTSDLNEFSQEATHVIGHFLKPVIDVVHLTLVMVRRAGARNVAIFYAFFAFADWSMRRIRQRALPKSLKELSSDGQRLESELRTRLARLDHYREQFALQGGTQVEKRSITKAFATLKRHLNQEIASYAVIDVISSYLVKYGGLMTAFSILTPSSYLDPTKKQQRIVADFSASSSLLGHLAAAVKDLGDSVGMLPRVRGLSERVAELESRLTLVDKAQERHKGFQTVVRNVNNHSISVEHLTVRLPASLDDVNLKEDVVTLTRDLSFQVNKGEHTVINGENGCGKSSLIRTIAGLWPPQEGKARLPSKLFFVPQDTYFTTGSLLEQLTYPDDASKLDENKARELLENVGLKPVADRYVSLKDACESWSSVLSGGERQRLSLARLMFHARQGEVEFAICDEPLSAVSKESIVDLITKTKKEGITLLTVSHSSEIDRQHSKCLHLTRDGEWTVKETNSIPEFV
jgi:ABC-type uncharacterized transport system fused permease/ATPase subunit